MVGEDVVSALTENIIIPKSFHVKGDMSVEAKCFVVVFYLPYPTVPYNESGVIRWLGHVVLPNV